MPKPNKELISVRVEPTLIRKVEKFAEKNMLNNSDVIRLALERMFDSNKKIVWKTNKLNSQKKN